MSEIPGFDGPVLRHGDAGFDTEAAANNTVIENRPDVVAGATSEADVVAAVRWAAEQGLGVRMLSTGHGVHSPITGGLLLNTSRIRGVSVDPEARTATIGAGATWGDVVSAAAEHDLIALTGSSPAVGVAGYLVGGGLGPLARSHGFSSDWLRSARVVTASGDVVTASETENADLFWALRGGKGGFGVVTEVTIELIEIAELYAGSLTFEGEHVDAAMRAWFTFTETAPPSVTSKATLLRMPPLDFIPEPIRGKTLLVVQFVIVGSAEEGEALVAPFRQVAPVFADDVRVTPAAEYARLLDEVHPPGPSWGRADLLRSVDGGFADIFLGEVGFGKRHPFMAIEVRHIGAMTTLDVAAGSAVGGRGGEYTIILIGVPDPMLFAEVLPTAAANIYGAIAEWVSPDLTINFANAPDAAAYDRCWPPAIRERLSTVRAEWDPEARFPYGPRKA